MGANAQTTVQKFLSGAVLTAEQQNISAATGVPVFATTVTRDAAFGGANKVLAEGQTCYLESTNVVQYYDGAAWAAVTRIASGNVAATAAGTAVTFPVGMFSSAPHVALGVRWETAGGAARYDASVAYFGPTDLGFVCSAPAGAAAFNVFWIAHQN